nr:hypothetical protein [uncultured Anaerobutyricum sp.]
MRLRSVFKMRTSILNTATTEQMGYGIFLFSSTRNLLIRFNLLIYLILLHILFQ